MNLKIRWKYNKIRRKLIKLNEKDWVKVKSEIGNREILKVISITITFTTTLIVSNCNWKF